MKYITLALLAFSLASIKTMDMDAAFAQGEVQRSTFIQAPSLISTDTSESSTNISDTTYSFQISVPQQAGASLQRVTITQQDPIEPISFSADRTTAFIKQPSGEQTPIQTSSTIDPQSRAISVVFVSPIPAGTTVVLGVRPVRNPSLEGQYIFGVTSFANNQQAQGQFIGVGRLGIYNNFGLRSSL